MEKNRLEKVRKHVFYENTKIVTKKWGGGKREEKIVKKLTNRVSEICWKKIVRKKSENTFFSKHMNIVMKNRGKKTREKFFKKYTMRVFKKC